MHSWLSQAAANSASNAAVSGPPMKTCRSSTRSIAADISGAIEDAAAPGGYGIVRQFVGHGIGTEMHQDPQIPNWGPPGRGPVLQEGVEIHEYRPALLHAKTAVIDGVWATVGSTNLDWRSFLHNDEVDAAILGRVLTIAVVPGAKSQLAVPLRNRHRLGRLQLLRCRQHL